MKNQFILLSLYQCTQLFFTVISTNAEKSPRKAPRAILCVTKLNDRASLQSITTAFVASQPPPVVISTKGGCVALADAEKSPGKGQSKLWASVNIDSGSL